MKKVIFTEAQMKHILGEDVFSGVYNDMTSKGTEYPVDSIPATQSEVIATEPGGEPFITDKYSDEKTPDSYMTKTGRYHAMYESSRKKKVVKNDEGKVVPEVCPKCGSKVGLYIKGEPVYLCSNEKCGEYFGTMPKVIEENWKGALLGTAMGAASLFSGMHANAQTSIPQQGNDTIGYNIHYGDGTQKQVWRNDFTPDEWNFHKKYFNKQLNRKMLTAQELKKLCPTAYKDRNNPNVWEKNQNKYVFNNPDGTINMKGKIAASRGQNPWEAIVAGESTVDPVTDEPIRIDADTMIKESFSFRKLLDERNEKMDKKKMFKAPPEVRKAAIPDGVHDEALERIRNGEPVSIEELYTWRTRGFGNDTIDRWVKQEVAMAQALGASLRNSAGAPEQKNINKTNTAITSDGSTVYYDNR
jgi:ribosomal protein L37AE/L43A